MNIKEINEEVLYTQGDITCITAEDIASLKDRAAHNPRKKVRLCSHKNVKDLLHEMLIVHTKGTYVRPHKHINKSESFHIIEGLLNVVIFNDFGDIRQVVNMGDISSGRVVYYRLSESYFHTVIPLSDFVVFHETTNGPFRPEDAIFAAWAPPEEDEVATVRYLESLGASLHLSASGS